MTEYSEPARTYRSVWIAGVILLLGFVVDLALGGGIVHLPGWLLGAALVLGPFALIVHAARSTRSLSLTPDELRVGDDAVPRAQIISARPEVTSDAPVLGWPSGMPRGCGGVTVELADGRQVAVPSRHPARLLSALSVPASAEPESRPIEIRAAEAADLPLLEEIDKRAEVLYEVAGIELPDFDLSHNDALAIFVAGRPAVGFVELDEVDGLGYVREVAVLPGAMRQGLGTRLVERAAGWARERGYPAIALTTYAQVPWNGPWYAARGFVELTDVPPGLAAIRARESEVGLDVPGRRIVMYREL